jgi:hypothetical protein
MSGLLCSGCRGLAAPRLAWMWDGLRGMFTDSVPLFSTMPGQDRQLARSKGDLPRMSRMQGAQAWQMRWVPAAGGVGATNRGWRSGAVEYDAVRPRRVVGF